jgi:hypothetical protein
VWIDFRGIQDEYMRGRGIDYFENSRRATLSQRAYAIANPGGWSGYSAELWGLTASDGPLDTTVVLDGRTRTFHTYWARGAGADEINDDGTLVPTAAGDAPPVRRRPLWPLRIPRRLQPNVAGGENAVATWTRRSRIGVVRWRLPWHRPGPHLGDDRELSNGARVAIDAEESLCGARAVPHRVQRRMARWTVFMTRGPRHR